MIKKLEKRLGISDLEAPRIRLAWGARFLFQIGFVVSWTIVTALWVENFGIHHLLWLFLIDACLYLFGTGVASFLLPRLGVFSFLSATISLTALFGWASFLFDPSQFVFFALVILAKDLFFSQTNIALYRYTEELFSPSEAQRFMPIIESAITIGALAGAGLTLWFLAFNSTQFVLTLWLASLVLLAFLILSTSHVLHTIPRFRPAEETSSQKPLRDAFHALRKVKFLRHILLVLLLQASLFTIVEFQFTRNVHSHIVPSHEVASVEMPLHASLLTDIKHSVERTTHEVKETFAKASSHLIMHKSLAHDLGMFELIFAAIALFVQFLVTPRTLKNFGVVWSIFSYFLILFLAVASTILGYFNVNWLRAIQHGTHSIGEAPYHISFYSLFAHSRESVRLFLEGCVKPVGMILGVGLIYFVPASFIFHAVLVVVALILVMCIPMRKSFTALSQKNLESEEDIEGKLHSIEVLSQRGHQNALSILASELRKKEGNPIIREKIIEALLDLRQPEVVHTYLEILRDADETFETKIQALDALTRLTIPPSYWDRHVFTRYHLLQTLRQLFETTNHGHLRKLVVMNLFQHLPSHKVAPFFLEKMAEADEKLQSIFLRSCQMFDDPEIVFYLQEYLRHPNSRIRSHAVIALWKFQEKEILRPLLQEMLHSDSEEAQVSALYAIGEVGDHALVEAVSEFAQHSTGWVRMQALIALAKLGDERAVGGLLSLLFGPDEALSQATFQMLKRVPEDMRNLIEREIQVEVSSRVAQILRPWKHVSLAKVRTDLPSSVYTLLKRLYRFADRYDDLMAVEAAQAEGRG